MADWAIDHPKVWSTLATNTVYIRGIIALHYSLKRVGSKYPLIVLYTDTFEPEGHELLDKNGIFKKKVEYIVPAVQKDYSEDPRFFDCWSKLQPFSLYEFERVVQLDSDMIILKNMDELFEIDLKGAPFAASYACVCNPYNKPHYPKEWVAENCVYTGYLPGKEHWQGPSLKQPQNKVIMCNGGLQVVVPSKASYQKILDQLGDGDATGAYDFADQSLLSDTFSGEWQPLSYKYNALKTIATIHSDVWDWEEVKNLHYILTPKPWEVQEGYPDDTGTFVRWHQIESERVASANADADATASANANARS